MTAPTLPRHLHRAVLRLLRPAEAAARRLVILAARGLAATPQARKEDIVEPPRQRPRETRPDEKAAHAVLRSLGIAVVAPHNVPHRAARSKARPRRTPARRATLPLFDPIRIPRPGRARTVPAHAAPRILSFNGAAPRRLPPPPTPDDPIDATRLTLRIQALASALDDLPGQARRFARWQARRRLDPPPHAGEGDHAKHGGGGIRHRRFRRISPLRPGRPPGLSAANRRRPAHEVHDVLADLQYFAVKALERPDTS